MVPNRQRRTSLRSFGYHYPALPGASKRFKIGGKGMKDEYKMTGKEWEEAQAFFRECDEAEAQAQAFEEFLEQEGFALTRNGLFYELESERGQAVARKYTKCLRTAVTPEQHERIVEDCEIAGMSRCRYLRERALGSHVVSKLDAKILRELNRIGGLLKHLYSKGEPTGPVLGELKKTLEHLRQ